MTQVLTYSALNAYRNCPRKYRYRFLDNLRPRDKADSLAFGTVIHAALELWYRLIGDPNRLLKVLDLVDAAFPNRATDEREKGSWLLARAMIQGYAIRYPAEDFEVVDIEKEFEGEIRNPDAGAQSKTFTMRGKVDGIVKLGGDLYVLEHKTASSIDANYLDKLWTDTQIALYAFYLRQLGIPVIGVVYNCLLKSRLKQRQGETEEEYEARKRELAAKNKSGKSTAQRQTPETDDEFLARLCDWYSKPEAFHRERIYIGEDRLAMVQDEVWEVTQQYLDAKRRGKFLPNTSFCFAWQRPCEYLPLCQNGGNPALLGNLYDVVPPHEELAATSELDF